MFKYIHNKVWIFDIEWIPDPTAGKLLYNLPDSMSNEEIMQEMWKQGGATEEEPMPYLKTAICRIVSISAIIRTVVNKSIQLNCFLSLIIPKIENIFQNPTL